LLKEGQLLFYKPFYFKDGGEPLDKFFIVLKNVNDETIVASLPTSKNNAPSLIDILHGCVNIDERQFNCYVFQEKKCVCDNGFSFDVHTYVYGDKVNDYLFKSLTDGQTYHISGQLTQTEFNALKECIINSNSTINRIKKLLKS